MKQSTKLKNQYFEWLFKEQNFQDLGQNLIRIDTPFLDNQFDNIVLYVEVLSNDRIIITDDGWTLSNLEDKGIYFNSQNKTNLTALENIISHLGIDRRHHELYIETDFSKFPIVKQRMLQAIMQVNDLIVLHKNVRRNIFFEEVADLLTKKEVLFVNKPSYAGKEGITIQFDFSIPTQKNEKLIRTIRYGNDLNRAKLLTMDTQLLRYTKTSAEYIAIFDDIHYPIKNLKTVQSVFNENSASKIIALPFSSAIEDQTILSNKVS